MSLRVRQANNHSMVRALAALVLLVLPSTVSAQQGQAILEARIDALVAAYPDALLGRDGDMLVWRDGLRMLLDDGLAKDHQERLDRADIEDMLSQAYPIGRCSYVAPALDFEPGRIRSDGFFRAMYGGTQAAVEARLVTIDWFGAPLRVTSVNGVASRLEAVRDELTQLPAELWPFFSTSAGTYNWRPIAGTSRLSVHSFGAAIDLNIDYSDYWLWNSRTGREDDVPQYRNRMPHEVVEVFERHGFIWGGKWYHFDTMHFEYRPELLAMAQLAECPA